MAEELGHQEFEAPHLCPKCREPKAEPHAVSEASVDVGPEEQASVPKPSATEPVVVAEPVSVPEPEPEPEWDLDSEAQSDGEPVSEVLPAFDESLLEEIGIKVKLIGNVKWFSRKKGFGFVTKADGEELFFHRSDVQLADLRQLRDGMQVEFQIRRTNKGLEAFDVSILPT